MREKIQIYAKNKRTYRIQYDLDMHEGGLNEKSSGSITGKLWEGSDLDDRLVPNSKLYNIEIRSVFGWKNVQKIKISFKFETQTNRSFALFEFIDRF